MSYQSSDGTAVSSACIFIIFILLINITIGSFCFNYDLQCCFGKTANFWVAGLCGLLLGELTIPSAIVCWVVSDLCGVETPFFGNK